jgi:hypothetical protein
MSLSSENSDERWGSWTEKGPIGKLRTSISSLEHTYPAELSRHPDIPRHVENIEEVEQMGMCRILTLARRMGVDSDELIRKTEEEKRALNDYSWKSSGLSATKSVHGFSAAKQQPVTVLPSVGSLQSLPMLSRSQAAYNPDRSF